MQQVTQQVTQRKKNPALVSFAAVIKDVTQRSL